MLSLKLLVSAALVVLLGVAAVTLWPDVGAILAVGAVVLFATGVVAANRWADRRSRDEGEPDTRDDPVHGLVAQREREHLTDQTPIAQ